MFVSNHSYQTESSQHQAVSSTANHWQQLQQHSSELQLLKLLQQYRQASGWIVLIAPGFKPAKAFWQACQLPLKHILVVHTHAATDLSQLIQATLQNPDCQAVICCQKLPSQQQQLLQTFAAQQQCTLHILPTDTMAAH